MLNYTRPHGSSARMLPGSHPVGASGRKWSWYAGGANSISFARGSTRLLRGVAAPSAVTHRYDAAGVAPRPAPPPSVGPVPVPVTFVTCGPSFSGSGQHEHCYFEKNLTSAKGCRGSSLTPRGGRRIWRIHRCVQHLRLGSIARAALPGISA